jgi:uncharacterized membrane protein
MNLLTDPVKYIRRHRQKLNLELLTSSFRSQVRSTARWTDKLADSLTSWFGTVTFLSANAVFFILWIVWNLGLFGTSRLDPFPFNLLTMVVSLEAIFLSTIVLISQNRQSRIAEIRQRMDFEIDIRAEDEITKILQLLAALHQHHGLKTEDDKELEEMLQKTDLRKIEEEVKKKAEAEG